MLYDPYFEIIQEEDYFIQVKSKNTGHCWNIAKNQFVQDRKITLYHKHNQSDPYFHEHRICRTVKDSIEQIKSHDKYVIDQEIKQKKIRERINGRPTRSLKVYRTCRNYNTEIPEILLQGDWLADWGFDIGDKIKVIRNDVGELLIVKE